MSADRTFKKIVIGTVLFMALIVLGVFFIVSSSASTEVAEETVKQDIDTEVMPEVVAYKYQMCYCMKENLTRMVFFEASVCSDDCQRAIASVAINMWQSGYWGYDLNEILTDYNRFSTAYRTAYEEIDLTDSFTRQQYERAAANVEYVMLNGITIAESCRYFRADYDFDWDGYENLYVIDNIYFGHFTNGNH